MQNNKANETAEKANEVAQKANALSEKLEAIEENRYKLEMRPFVIVMGIRAYVLTLDTIVKDKKLYVQIGKTDDLPSIGLALQLMNTTQSFVTVEYRGGAIDQGNELMHSCANKSVSKIHLAPGEMDEIILCASSDFMSELNKKWLSLQFVLYKESSLMFEKQRKISRAL